MAKTKVELNYDEVGKLLKSSAVRADLEQRAQRIAAAAGPGHVVHSQIGPSRARAVVITATPEAMRNEEKHHSLTRAVDAGR